MAITEPEAVRETKVPVILLTGGTGYVGGRLIPLLEQQHVTLRCLARDPAKLRFRVQPKTEIVQGDVLDSKRSVSPGSPLFTGASR